jgi:hypothetical protein
MDWKKGAALEPDQTGHPILWHGALADLGYGEIAALPALAPQWFFKLWGDERASTRLKTFGHKGGRKEGIIPHFLCTRGGYPMHTDPGATRYALQIQLHNDGFIVHGLEDDLAQMPLFSPGLAIILDTWSPHQVARDLRLPQTGANKLLVGADYADYPAVEVELPKLIEHIPALAIP